jgi:hypothetical protein
MKIILSLMLILLTGCNALPKYQYESQSSIDPTIIFGDRVGDHAISGHHQIFDMNIIDAASNKCGDFNRAAFTSNNYMRIWPMSIQIKIPAGRSLAIRGSVGAPSYSCAPPTRIFMPKDGVTYGVNIALIGDKCFLNIVETRENSQDVTVSDLTALPVCQ